MEAGSSELEHDAVRIICTFELESILPLAQCKLELLAFH